MIYSSAQARLRGRATLVRYNKVPSGRGIYLEPRQFLVPLEKGTKDLSSLWRSSISPSHRSGSKRNGSGYTSGLWCMWNIDKLTGVFLGIVQFWYCSTRSGAARAERIVAPNPSRRDSFNTAVKYGSFSSSWNLTGCRGSGITVRISARSRTSMSGLVVRYQIAVVSVQDTVPVPAFKIVLASNIKRFAVFSDGPRSVSAMISRSTVGCSLVLHPRQHRPSTIIKLGVVLLVRVCLQ